MNELERRFHSEMVNIYQRAKKECGYSATRFLQMLSESGGLATAKVLLRNADPSDGFTALWELRRLDLTVEAVVLRDPWKALFNEDELEIARKRLADLGYAPTS